MEFLPFASLYDVLSGFYRFQDSRQQNGELLCANVTPTNTDVISNDRIYNIPLTIDGKVVRLLIATDAILPDPNEGPPAETSIANEAIDSKDATVSDKQGTIREIEKIVTHSTDQDTLTYSAVDEVKHALQATVNAYRRLKAVRQGTRMGDAGTSILFRTYKMRDFAKQIVKLVRNAPSSNFNQTGGEAVPKQDGDEEKCARTEELLQQLIEAFAEGSVPDGFTADEFDSLRAWLNSL